MSLIAPHHEDGLLLELAAAWLDEPSLDRSPSSEIALLAVVGAHLSGQPLNRQLTDLGGRLEAVTRTAAVYRLYALAGAYPPKPGLVLTGRDGGTAIEVEVWRLAPAALGRIAAGVRPPPSIGAVELVDGSSVPGFVCDSAITQTAREITAWGGWRAFLAAGAGAPVR